MSDKFRTRGFAAIIIAAAITGLLARAQASDAPKAIVPASTYDFGTVKQGTKVSHCFEVRNQGAAPLKIEKMQLTYPQMTARATGSIKPGGSGQICIDLGTDDLSLKVKPQATVFVNDPEQGAFTLALTGVVQAPVDLVPMSAVLASTWKGETGEKSISIVNNRTKPLTVRGIDTEGQHFKARIETEKPGQVYKLVVTVPGDVAPGYYTGAVFVNTDSARYARIRVPVNILVKNEIYTFPLVVNFHSVDLAQLNSNPAALVDLAESFLVKKRSGTFQIKSITSDIAALQITQTPNGESNTFRIGVTLLKDRLQPGPLSGKIRLVTNDSAVSEVIVPVTGRVE